MSFLLHCGNSLEVLSQLSGNSFDSVVTDPPYEMGFMGKTWDKSGVANSVPLWREVFRVLKPGGHVLSFGGARTYHRMSCAIEDAGFEIRDQIMWLYGSGFPKSLDVSKALDKEVGAVRAVVGLGKGRTGAAAQPNGSSFSDDAYQWPGVFDDTAPATEAAQRWEGWGTALKPAHEPICVARKPLIGTVAASVLAHGVGGLNIDGCRVPTLGEKTGGSGAAKAGTAAYGDFAGNGGNETSALGRWPANVIHDGSDEVRAHFPDAKGQQGDLKETGRDRPSLGRFGDMSPPVAHPARIELDTSAARFFYCAKTSSRERHAGLQDPGTQFAHGSTLHQVENKAGAGNHHPTVKPLALMAYLCRLVTPSGGLVLDPFMGSGSTGIACVQEGFRFEGIDLSAEYVEISRARIAHAQRGMAPADCLDLLF